MIKKTSKVKGFIYSLMFLNTFTLPFVAHSQSAYYHTQVIPMGNFTYYEKALKKNVSYQRYGNVMYGALYNPQDPATFTCFQGQIGPQGVSVNWHNNLWQIGVPKANYYQRFYSIRDFSADNVGFREGLENPVAIVLCFPSE